MLLVDEDGKQKYANLARLALQILLLPHGNVDPERGFSVNKRLLEKHSNNISEDMLESARITKDFIIQSGGQVNVKVTTEMIEKCKVSNSKYEKQKAEKDKKEVDINKKKEAEKEKEAKKKRREEIENNIRIVESKIQPVEQIIDDGNKLLKACVKKITLKSSLMDNKKWKLDSNENLN